MSQDQASLRVPDGGVKMLRESLCAAQAALALTEDRRALHHHLARLQDLIDQCDRHRPLGWDGKHGDRHTATCGCEDVDEPGQGVALLHAMADEIERLAGGADRLPVAGVLATIRTYAEAQR